MCNVRRKKKICQTSSIYLFNQKNKPREKEMKEKISAQGSECDSLDFHPVKGIRAEPCLLRFPFSFSPPFCFSSPAPSLSLHPPVTFSALASSLGWRITAWHITLFLHLFQENHGPVVPHSSDSSFLILSSSPSHWAHLANSQSSQTVWEIKLPAP